MTTDFGGVGGASKQISQEGRLDRMLSRNRERRDPRHPSIRESNEEDTVLTLVGSVGARVPVLTRDTPMAGDTWDHTQLPVRRLGTGRIKRRGPHGSRDTTAHDGHVGPLNSVRPERLFQHLPST